MPHEIKTMNCPPHELFRVAPPRSPTAVRTLPCAWLVALCLGACSLAHAEHAPGEVRLTEAAANTLRTEAAFLRDHDAEKAEIGFLHSTRITPSYAPPWFDLGVLAESRQDWGGAIKYFQHYLTLEPAGADAGRARSQLVLLAKYQDGSITAGDTARMEYEASIARARALAAQGHLSAAAAEAKTAQVSHPDRWEAYAVLSLVAAKQKNSSQAASFRTLALEHAPVEKREQLKAALTSKAG
jgi:tetratricopeptide (TPR) repeat protein